MNEIATVLGILVPAIAGTSWCLNRLRATRRRPVPTLSSLRRVATILVVDDSPFPYLADFKEDGYNIEQHFRVDSIEKLQRRADDIVILDIRGVAKHLSARDGLGVADMLRLGDPSVVLIIYSSGDFNIAEERSSVDHAIDVSSTDYTKFRSLIDDAIQALNSPPYLMRNLDRSLKHPLTQSNRKQVERVVASALGQPHFLPSLPRKWPHDLEVAVRPITDRAKSIRERLSPQ